MKTMNGGWLGFQKNNFMVKTAPTFTKIGFYLLIAVGVFLRFYRFGQVPSIISPNKTDLDQNNSYYLISTPISDFFNNSIVSTRYLSAILGVFLVILIYFLAKQFFKNQYFASAVVLIYLFDPFLIMISRWASVFNIVPFFVILGLLLIISTINILNSKAQLTIFETIICVLSIPSLAIIVFLKASSIIVIGTFSILVFLYFRRIIFENWKMFAISVIIFLAFSITNILAIKGFGFSNFSKTLAIIKKNFIFIFSDFKEFDRFANTTKFYNTHFFLPFGVLALAYLGFQLFSKTKIKQIGEAKFEFSSLSSGSVILFFWSIASLIPFVFFDMDLNKSVYLQAVIPLLSIFGVFLFFENLPNTNYKRYLLISFFAVFLIQSILFFNEYFTRFVG
jgi:4-amino-4-deoxy-L-arabinose transferase-like glycosyltransferase